MIVPVEEMHSADDSAATMAHWWRFTASPRTKRVSLIAYCPRERLLRYQRYRRASRAHIATGLGTIVHIDCGYPSMIRNTVPQAGGLAFRQAAPRNRRSTTSPGHRRIGNRIPHTR